MLDVEVPFVERAASRDDLGGEKCGGLLARHVVAALGADFEIAKTRDLARHHASLCGVVKTLGLLAECRGENFLQPFLLHGGCEGEQRLHVVAAVHFAHLAHDEQRGILHDALAGEYAAASVDELHAQCPAIEPDADEIGEACEDAAGGVLGARVARFGGEAFVARDAEELLRQCERLARGDAVDSERTQLLRIEVCILREAQRAQHHEEVAAPVAAEQVFAVVLLLLALAAVEDRLPLRERGDLADRGHAAALVRGEQHPRVPRVRGECEHPPAKPGDLAGGIGRAEIEQQCLRAFERLRLGRFEPAEICNVVHAASL